MRSRDGEKPFKVKERIVLHLGEQRVSRDHDVPNSVTQEGISLAVGVGRGNAARALKEMERDGIVISRKARPLGKSHVAKYYSLAEAGIADLSSILDRANALEVRVSTASGEKGVPLADIPAYVPAGCTLSDVVRAVRFGRLDLEGLEIGRIRRGPAGHVNRNVPEPGQFFGRSPELATAADWLRSPSSRVLCITGMAGIGKTAFMTKFASGLLGRTNVCWLSLRSWTTAAEAAADLGAFSAALGGKRVAAAAAQDRWNPSSVGAALASDFTRMDALVIVDDVHAAEGDLVSFIAMMCEAAKASRGVKLALLSRRKPTVYGRRDVLEGIVTEARLGFLDRAASAKLLASRGVPQRGLVRMCGGYPLFLKLANSEGDSMDVGLADYLRSEVFPGLSKAEWSVLALAALSRDPLPVDALLGPLGATRDALESIAERGMAEVHPVAALKLHDVISGYVRLRLSDLEKRSAHLALGRYHGSCVGPSSGLEAIFHLCKAGEITEAKALFSNMALDLVRKGYVRGLDAAADELCAGIPETDPAILLAVGRVYQHVGRWDEAVRKLGAAIVMAREQRSRGVECEALCSIGELSLRRGAKADARRALEQAVKLSSGARDAEAEARARYYLGSLFEGSDPERAGQEFDAARALGESAGSPTALAMALYGRGRLEEKAGRIGRARYYKERALKLLDKTDEKTTVLKLLISLGANSFAMRDSASAIDYFTRAVAISRETCNMPMEGVGLANLGGAFIEKPDLVAAASALEAARDILAGIQDMRMLVRVHNNLSLVDCQRGRFEEAVSHAEAGVEVAGQLGDVRSMAKAQAYLGTALAGAGRKEDAKAAFEKGASLAAKAGDASLQKEIMKEFSGVHRAGRR